MKISEKIYKLRTDLGLSQKDFAEQVGTSQSAINYWENGKREPRNNQLKKIATKYKIPLYILTDDSFDMWDINDPLNKNRARFVGDTNMPTPPHFTAPLSDDTIEIDTDINTSHPFYLLQEKLKRGKGLSAEEEKQYLFYLHEAEIAFSESLQRLGTAIRTYYELLNENGQKIADEEIERTIKQVEMLTKIPEYQRKEEIKN